MRVLMPALHYYPVIGGIETWTKNIAERLSEKAEIFVVTGKVKGQPQKEIKNGVKIYRTSLFFLSNLSASPIIYSLSLLPFIFFKSYKLTKKEKIDILHCQGFLSSFLGFWLSLFTKIPYIVTVQRLESKRNPLKNLVYRKAALCVAASGAIKKIFEEMGVKNIEVIPNGIDLERFVSLREMSRRDKNIKRQSKEGFVVITVARLEKVKGMEYLIGAIAELVDTECQPKDTRCQIIGDGSERKNLEKLVEKLGLEEKVKFLGEIPNEKIPDYLAMADCFVLPSLKEGFGIALLEAMAAGVPPIATKVGGILDIIEDGKTGILVEPKNPQAIAEAIKEIHLGRKFTKPNLEKYNWQNIADKVYKIYEENYNRSRNISS